jgi:hypothetical protein
MAKRKTPKVKDLRPETITKEELKQIQEVVSIMNQLQTQVGMLESQKFEMLQLLDARKSQTRVMHEKFMKQYGSADIDIATGKIKYNGNDETDKEDNSR